MRILQRLALNYCSITCYMVVEFILQSVAVGKVLETVASHFKSTTPIL